MKSLALLFFLVLLGCGPTLSNNIIGLTVSEWRSRTYGEQLVSRTSTREVWYADGKGYLFVNGVLQEIKTPPYDPAAAAARLELLREQRRIFEGMSGKRRQQPKSNCTSTVIGNQIFTNCN